MKSAVWNQLLVFLLKQIDNELLSAVKEKYLTLYWAQSLYWWRIANKITNKWVKIKRNFFINWERETIRFQTGLTGCDSALNCRLSNVMLDINIESASVTRFGKISPLGQTFEGYLVFGKILNLLWQKKSHILGKFELFVSSQLMKNNLAIGSYWLIDPVRHLSGAHLLTCLRPLTYLPSGSNCIGRGWVWGCNPCPVKELDKMEKGLEDLNGLNNNSTKKKRPTIFLR